jgi:hypothetical protein
MKLVKTRTPDSYPGKIVTQPTGEQIYWIISLTDDQVTEHGLQDDVIPDTAAYFAEKEIGIPWEEGMELEVGKVVAYEDAYYRVVQAHTVQADWTPPAVPALFVETDPFNIEKWKQPTGAHDAIPLDGLREHNGKVWKSKINANTTEPGSDDRWWEEV